MSAFQAIRTQYHGPTNYRGARIIATSSGGDRVTISYPYELNSEDGHRKAAQALIDKLSWGHCGKFASGCFRGDYYHVFAD